MLRVGLTGGIGSGKSEVARLLAGHGGQELLDPIDLQVGFAVSKYRNQFKQV